jgi:hypothetical protein
MRKPSIVIPEDVTASELKKVIRSQIGVKKSFDNRKFTEQVQKGLKEIKKQPSKAPVLP